ncbi:MAG TPA: hypothetical protein PKA00_09380 [Saprospiraceae bacterium]|nr:hypothetical protein [Saprospiraceae bacterium]HMQ83109.1 hypothetical protein [Saprospiraceae bacterium]
MTMLINLNTFTGLFHAALVGLAFLGICSQMPAQQVYVSSRNTNSVKLYYLSDGAFLGDIVAPGSGGLSLPQEVLYHPDGFILVTGRGNTSIKKYDVETGAYLGNFTSGYSLDNPTKSTVWQDSLLYVSQWGQAQNKVVRFNWHSGAFVDEFTSVGVPNGCGHAWDGAGNLYVAQFLDGVNGKVLKFDAAGDLIGTFIPTGMVRGPVNVWFNAEGNLMVADWTLGNVQAFDGVSGAFQAVLISGLSNVEGYAFDREGRLYLCDWTANKIFRYDSAANTLSPFIESGGLMAPNSLFIHEETTNDSSVEPSLFSAFDIYPNPVKERLMIDYTLQASGQLSITLLNESGQLLSTLFAGVQSAGRHRLNWERSHSKETIVGGLYYIRLQMGEDAMVKPMLLE